MILMFLITLGMTNIYWAQLTVSDWENTARKAGVSISMMPMQKHVFNDDWAQLFWYYIPDDMSEEDLDQLMEMLSWRKENPLNWLNFTEDDLLLFDILPEEVTLQILEIQQIIKGLCDNIADHASLCQAQILCEISNIVSMRAAHDPTLQSVIQHFFTFPGIEEIPVNCIESPSPEPPAGASKMIGNKWRSLSWPITMDSRISGTLPVSAGYEDGYYLGSGVRYQERIGLSTQRMNLHLARNKLPGEYMQYPQINGNSTGFAEASLSAGKVSILLGDYIIRYGGGLILGSSGMQSGTRSMQRANFFNHRYTPYRSGAYGVHQRGVLLHYGPQWITTTLFYSNRNLSASRLSDGQLRYPVWSSAKRTESELARYGNITLQNGGILVSKAFPIRRTDMRLGGAMVHSWFDQPIGKSSNWHDQKRFAGKQLTEMALAADVRYLRTRYSAEVATTDRSGLSYMHGLSTTFRGSTVGGWHRYFNESHHSVFGNPPGVFSGTGNERGTGAWISHRVSSGLTLRIYADQYASIFPRNGFMLPHHGRELGIRGELRRRGGYRYRGEISFRNDADTHKTTDPFGREIAVPVSRDRFSLKMTADVPINAVLHFQNRMELRQLDLPGVSENGFALVNFVRYRTSGAELYVQHANFNTGSHQSAVYLFEYDMIGTIRIPSFSGMGSRSVVIIQFQPRDWVVFRLKYGITRYSDRSVVGSGRDQTVGEVRSDAGFQVIMRPRR